MITIDDNIREKIEPFAPSVEDRLNAIKKLINNGINVIVRIQPFIYPFVMNNFEEFIIKLNNIGVKTIIIEGLKIKTTLSQNEKEIYDEMSNVVGYNIIDWFKTNGEKHGSDYTISTSDKIEYIKKVNNICKKYNISVNVGDNDCRDMSHNKECCGTSCLRNHKTLIECKEILDRKYTNSRSKKSCTIIEKINNTNILN